jgi:hypothetical protein
MNDSTVQYVLLQLLSLLITGYILLSIFTIHTGLIGRFYIAPVVLTLASAIAVRYSALYHRFSKPKYRQFTLFPLTIALIVSGIVAVEHFFAAVSLEEFRLVFQNDMFRIGSANFLPEWWIAVLFLSAGVLILAGSVTAEEPSTYPKPSIIREIATSPVYFGIVCSFFGFWAVLFVGIAIQRIVIIAPIFEELLKFGVALLVGSVLFGRSLSARIGVAIVVGSLFGVVEHTTTYPTETDISYLFRTLFHLVTTVLSVNVYTLLESQGESELQWIAPAYPILLHFYYNTFVVLSAVLGLAVPGLQNTIVAQIYGFGAILLAIVLVSLTGISPRTLIGIHRPLEHVLSDLV